jgi:FeS assembly SUF system protein
MSEPAERDRAASADPGATERLREAIVAVLKTCYDPEIPVDIYELGLVYDVDVDAAGHASVRMTLTSPACPVAGSLPGEVEQKVRAVPGVTRVTVDLVWDPPWNQDMMSEAARLRLGFF